jgi:cytochrome c-type biogenesis protein CcmF
VVIGIVLFVVGIRQWYALVAFFICAFVLSTIFSEWFRGTRARYHMKRENYFKAFWGLLAANRSRYGGYIVHIGIVLLAIGVIGSSFYEVEKESDKAYKGAVGAPFPPPPGGSREVLATR